MLGCCAAGRGAATPGTAARLAAATATRTTASTSSVSASVASPRTYSLPFNSLFLYPWLFGYWLDSNTEDISYTKTILHPLAPEAPRDFFYTALAGVCRNGPSSRPIRPSTPPIEKISQWIVPVHCGIMLCQLLGVLSRWTMDVILILSKCTHVQPLTIERWPVSLQTLLCIGVSPPDPLASSFKT